MDVPLGQFLQYGLLGVVFLMVIFRIGIMTTKAHDEVVKLLQEALEYHRKRADDAEASAKVAVQAAEVTNAALNAMRRAVSEPHAGS